MIYNWMSLNASGLRNERGSSTYSFLGFAIIAVVIVVAVLFFPWGDLGKQAQDPDLNAGMTALDKKQYPEALAAFDKALKKNPDNTTALIGKSKAEFAQGNLDKALEYADAAVQKKGGAKAYGQKGIIEKVQKNYDAALKDFTEAIKADSNYAWALAQRADIFSRQKQQDKALEDINKAIAAKPDYVDAYRMRVWVLNRMGKCKEASEDMKKVEKLSPNDAWTLQDKAWFLLTCPDEKLQDPAKAMELAKKANEMTDGKDGVIQETIAEAYFKQGDPLKAYEHQKKAIELGSKKCPDGSCLKEMQQRLQKYELAARQEVRTGYEILSMDSGK